MKEGILAMFMPGPMELLLLLLVGLLLLGGVALVALLVHPKTRKVAAVLLGIGLGGMLLLGLAISLIVHFSHQSWREVTQQERIEAEQRAHAMRMQVEAERMQVVTEMEARRAALQGQLDRLRQESIEEWPEAAFGPQFRGFFDDGDLQAVEKHRQAIEDVQRQIERQQQEIRQWHQEASNVIASTPDGRPSGVVVAKRATGLFLAPVVLVGLIVLGIAGVTLGLLLRPGARKVGLIMLLVGLPIALLVAAGVFWTESIDVRTPTLTSADVHAQPEQPARVFPQQEFILTPPYYSPDGVDATVEPPADTLVMESPTTPTTEAPASRERPAWVDQPWGQVDGKYRRVLVTDPRPTLAECEDDLQTQLQTTVSVYAQDVLGQSRWIARDVRLAPDYVEENLIREKWLERVDVDLPGDWLRLHVLLEIDSAAERQIYSACARAEQEKNERRAEIGAFKRLGYVGTGLAALLMLLAVLYACLRIDRATDGARRIRVCLAGGAMLVLAGGLVMVAILTIDELIGRV